MSGDADEDALERAKLNFRMRHFRKKMKRGRDTWEAKYRPGRGSRERRQRRAKEDGRGY